MRRATRGGRSRLTVLLAAGALAVPSLVLAGCGEDEAEPQGGATTGGASTEEASGPARERVEVDIASFRYLPRTVRVLAGGEVVWTNKDKAPHTSTDEMQPRRFDTDTIRTDGTDAVTFDEPGTYEYFCLFHPFMTGTVEVVEN